MHSTRNVRTALMVACVLTALTVPLAAHHGWTGYDEKNPLTLTGTVKASEYANPHGFVELDVNGKVWHVVLAPTSRMQARGLTREMLKAGTKAPSSDIPTGKHRLSFVQSESRSVTRRLNCVNDGALSG